MSLETTHFDRNGSGHERQGTPVSSIDPSNSAPRSRRRLAAWLAFGAVGLATGAVWASGFASVSASQRRHRRLAGARRRPLRRPRRRRSRGTDDRRHADSPSTGRAVGARSPPTRHVQGRPERRGLRRQDLQRRAAARQHVRADRLGLDAARGRARRRGRRPARCTAADFDGHQRPTKVLNFDDEDAGVYWNALAGDAVYCIGVASSPGDDVAGTFLRAAAGHAPRAPSRRSSRRSTALRNRTPAGRARARPAAVLARHAAHHPPRRSRRPPRRRAVRRARGAECGGRACRAGVSPVGSAGAGRGRR